MTILISLLLLLTLAVLVFLFGRLRAQSTLLRKLQNEQAALASAWSSRPVNLHDIPGSRLDPVITIKILNPVELAAKESKFAGTINNFAPDVIKQIVYKRTTDILREELTTKGVQVEIKVHGLG